MKAKQIILEAVSRREMNNKIVADGVAALDQCPSNEHTVWSLVTAANNDHVEMSNTSFDCYGRKTMAWTWVGRDDDGLYADKAVYCFSGTSISSGMWAHGKILSCFSRYEKQRQSMQDYSNYLPSNTRYFSPNELAVMDQIGFALHAYLPVER